MERILLGKNKTRGGSKQTKEEVIWSEPKAARIVGSPASEQGATSAIPRAKLNQDTLSPAAKAKTQEALSW